MRTVVALVVAACFSCVTATSTAAPTMQLCGVERWSVKTLQDRPTLFPTQQTTIAKLVSLTPPAVLPHTRLPAEQPVYQLVAQVVLVRHEGDSDLHLVLHDGAGNQMIAEAPLQSCTTGANAPRRQQMAQARAAVKLCASATITGVLFFDFNHGQTGVAPNAVELHPILSFKC